MQGFQAEILLLFTVLIWTMYLLVYISSPQNKVNQWCCICGFLLSIGVLKEYIVAAGICAGRQIHIFEKTYEMEEFLNSILTAVLYYISMPCVMIFSMYFCHADKRCPRVFRLLCVLVFFPVFVFGAVYPWSQTRRIPQTNPLAFHYVALYNLIYGAVATILIITSLIKEKKSCQFRQRRRVSLIGLLPLWYWLITLFLFHLLKLEKLYKFWQGNVFVVLFLFVYYVRCLFREGIWGMRLNREYFDWSEENSGLPENISSIVHMLKGETAKISWCSGSIRQLDIPEACPELDIIDRSVSHMEEFVRRSHMYSQEIDLIREPVEVCRLFQEIRDECREKWEGQIEIKADDHAPPLSCDYHYMKEVLYNLAENAIDAMGDKGTLRFSYRITRKNIALIQVEDTGKGIPRKEIPHIFQPYYTGRRDALHFGLGLPYCQKVIGKHGGYIQVKSPADSTGRGAVFTICLPVRNGKRRRHAGNS